MKAINMNKIGKNVNNREFNVHQADNKKLCPTLKYNINITLCFLTKNGLKKLSSNHKAKI